MTAHRPPIPAQAAARPTIGGLVIPYVQVRLADGGVDFRARHNPSLTVCFERAVCQVCGEPLHARPVFLAQDSALPFLVFGEPAMHAACAAYTARACPMVSGRMAHHPAGPSLSEGPRGRGCDLPGCDCAGWVRADTPREGGPVAARPWVAVVVETYEVVQDTTGALMAYVRPEWVLAVRAVTGAERGAPWRAMDVAAVLAAHQPPTPADTHRQPL